MIEVKNVYFEYTSAAVLKDVSFVIPEGSITALVGPNGAGKTTIMKCIAGVDKPLSGSIYVDGIDVIEEPRKAHNVIGFLSDFFGLYDHLTVYQCLKYFSLAHRIPQEKIDKSIKLTLERLNLSKKINEDVSSLSRGMRQRLAIAQAIIFNPKCIILDEPASGLDPEARHSLGELLIQLNKEGITILVSSHILAELDQYANEMIILENGEVKKQCKISEDNEQLSTVNLVTSSPLGKTKITLRKISLIKEFTNSENVFTLEILNQKDSKEKIIENLIKSKIKVSEFYIKKSNIQDKYIDILNSKR